MRNFIKNSTIMLLMLLATKAGVMGVGGVSKCCSSSFSIGMTAQVGTEPSTKLSVTFGIFQTKYVTQK